MLTYIYSKPLEITGAQKMHVKGYRCLFLVVTAVALGGCGKKKSSADDLSGEVSDQASEHAQAEVESSITAASATPDAGDSTSLVAACTATTTCPAGGATLTFNFGGTCGGSATHVFAAGSTTSATVTCGPAQKWIKGFAQTNAKFDSLTDSITYNAKTETAFDRAGSTYTRTVNGTEAVVFSIPAMGATSGTFTRTISTSKKTIARSDRTGTNTITHTNFSVQVSYSVANGKAGAHNKWVSNGTMTIDGTNVAVTNLTHGMGSDGTTRCRFALSGKQVIGPFTNKKGATFSLTIAHDPASATAGAPAIPTDANACPTQYLVSKDGTTWTLRPAKALASGSALSDEFVDSSK